MAEKLVNRATTYLATLAGPASSTITVTGSYSFPTAGNFRILVEGEIMIVTATNGNIWTVTRGAEGTTVNTHLTGTKVTTVLTAGGLTQYIAEQIAASK